MPILSSTEKGTPGVSITYASSHIYSVCVCVCVCVCFNKHVLCPAGITVRCPGSPGHGSRFVENTAAEKLVSVFRM